MSESEIQENTPSDSQKSSAGKFAQIHGWKDFVPQLDREMAESYEQAGMGVKRAVLYMALKIEQQSSVMLGQLLGVDVEKSKVLGYLGRPLEFSQKVQLLIEVGGLKKDDHQLFTTFMEIRNMMLHNYSAHSTAKCLEMLSEKLKSNKIKNLLLKIADEAFAQIEEQESITEEAKLDIGVRILAGKVFNKTNEIVNVVRHRNWNRANLALTSALYAEAPERLAKPFQEHVNRFTKEVEIGSTKTYSAREVHKVIIDLMSEIFLNEEVAAKTFEHEDLDNASFIHPDQVSWLPPVNAAAFLPSQRGDENDMATP